MFRDNGTILMPAAVQLLWGAGSLPVAETKRLNGYGDRQYAVVRAGL